MTDHTWTISTDEQARIDAAHERYRMVRGAYHGTSDDRIDRWYTDDTEGPSDRRGDGWRTRAEAWAALDERIVMDARMDAQVKASMVSVTEIAQRAGTTPGTVHQWRHRHDTFPAPVTVLATGPVWWWEDVERWLAIPRKAGRPARK